MSINIEPIKKLVSEASFKTRVFMGVGMFVPLAILGTVFYFRIPEFTKYRNEILSIYKLESEIKQLESGWSNEEEMNVTAKWFDIMGGLLPNYRNLASWLEYLHDRAGASGLTLTYKIQNVKPATDSTIGLSVATVDISLKGEPKTVGNAKFLPGAFVYYASLDFIKSVAEANEGVEIAKLALNGAGQGPASVDMTLAIWLGFETAPTDSGEDVSKG